MLARESTKLVTFDWQAALDFNGQAAPYIQYAHVRANSILNAGKRRLLEMDRRRSTLPAPLTAVHSLTPTEIQLIDLLSRVPGEVQRAASELRPLYIANLAYEMARAFTDFYNACPVLKAEPETRAFRLRLVAATRQAIANLLESARHPGAAGDVSRGRCRLPKPFVSI